MKIDLIKVPLFYGCDNEGVEEGPQVLVDNGLIDLLTESGNDVRDLGAVTVPCLTLEDKYKANKTMKYLDAIIQTNEELAGKVAGSLLEGHLPFTLGGDHSLGLGTLAGTTKVNGTDIGVIWVDAHADINTAETSPSGNVHGMPLGASLGEGYDALVNLYYDGQKVKPQNCFIIGARSIDDGEVELIDRLGINVWYMEEIREKGMGIIIQEVLQMLEHRGIKDLHISYDIDSLDAGLVPGTGTPVEDGLLYDESDKLIRSLIATRLVRSVDFVEFNPRTDNPDSVTFKSAFRMLTAFAEALGQVEASREAV